MERRTAGALLALAACIACSTAAPMASSNQTALDVYDGATEGCYYNFQHYREGDRIMTNEPCLNCTCHNRMLMCYLRVCPFTKPIGQDCTVEKRADQCCPIVTCPDVPVDLLTSTSTSSPAEYGGTGIGKQDKYGCSINGRYFPEGSKVPPSPNKPCEHCYCIRNMTTCVMQECTLHVDGCVPIYHKDVCCPVRYSCDHPEDEIPLLDDMTTTVRPTPGFLLTTTTLTPVTQASQDCMHDDQIFADGALIKTEKACEHCYCMKGDIVCVVQECGTPMENEGKNCTSLPPRHGQCCPDTYICEGDELVTDQSPEVTTEAIVLSTNPPRKGVEGSGYRKETDESYTDMPIFDTTEPEGSGEDQPTLSVGESEPLMPEKQTPDLEDEMFITTAKESEFKPHSSTVEPSLGETKVPKSESSAEQSPPEYEPEIATESTKPDTDAEDEISLNKEGEDSANKDIEITHDVKESQEPSLTTITDDSNDVSSSSDGLTSREDQFIITTESSFRKEDFIPTITEKTSEAALNEVTTQGTFNDATTQDIFKETTTQGTLMEAATQGTFNEVTTESTAKDVTENELYEHKFTVEEYKEPVTLSEDTATLGANTYIDDALRTTESSGKGDVTQYEKEISNEYGSSSTYKSELLETTTLNPIENEIDEDSHESAGRIPGEGDCLLNGITYKNYTTVPSTNKCHTQCRCVSSIVKCDPIICSPPPEDANMNKCQPMYDSAESCCPTYICDQSKDTILPESHSQMSGTESPKPIHGSECNGDECKIIEEKEKIVPIHPELPGVPGCGSDGCAADTGSTTAQRKECVDGKCDPSLNKDLPCDASTGCQVSPVKPCEGDDCTIRQDFKTPEGQINVIEKECDNDSCRRKETSQDAKEPTSICIGDQCIYPPESDNVPKELTSEAPIIQEVTTKVIEADVTATISPDNSITKTDQEVTSILEEQTAYETSSKKIDSDSEEQTTKYEEYHPKATEASVTPGAELFTTEQPKEEIDVHEIYTEHGALTEISTTIPATINEKEYVTSTSHNLLTEPTLAEENTETQKTEEEITLDENNLTTEAFIPSSEPQEIATAKADKMTTQSTPLTSSPQEYTLQDTEKETVMFDISNENTTPVKDDEKYLKETDATESMVTEGITDKEHKEKELTTVSPTLIQDSDYATEAHISKGEDTTSQTMEEITTKLEEAHSIDENSTEDIMDNIYTTQRNLETTKLHEVPTDSSSVDKIIDDAKVPLVSTELTGGMSTESSVVDTMEEKITPQISDGSDAEHDIKVETTEAMPSDTEQYKTTKLPDSEVPEDILGTKEPELEESITKMPAAEDKHGDEISQTTKLDQMESLNGRGTESPNEIVETESPAEIGHSSEADMYYTTISEGIQSGFDMTQTELAGSSTESTLDTSQKTLIGDIATTLPMKDVDEVIKLDTDSQMLTTEPSRKAEVASEVSQIDENDENIISTDVVKEFSTELPSFSDLHIKDKETTEETDTELQEITQKSELHISTESITNVDTVSEPITDTQKISTTDLHISDKEERTTPTTVDNSLGGHEIEISTSKVYPNIEDVTETFTEDLSHVSQQTDEVKTSEDDHLEISTELPGEVVTTSQDDLSIPRTTLLPETSENVQTSTTKQDKDITQSSSLSPGKDDLTIAVSPSDDSSEPGSYGVDQTTELDKSEEVITQKLDVTTTSAVEISETDDKKESTDAPHIMEESYPHDITSESALMTEEETFDKGTTVPQVSDTDDKKESTDAPHKMEESYPHDITSESALITEEETFDKGTTVSQVITEEQSHTGYPENDATITSQAPEINDIMSTTEILEMQTSKTSEQHPFTISHSITTDVHGEEKYIEKLDMPTTETTEIFPERDDSNTQLEDKSSEIPDSITPTSQIDVTEMMINLQETSKTTYRPDLGTSENLTTEKAELTKTPEHNANIDENTMKIKDMISTEEYMTDLTESTERVTKVDDREGGLIEEKLTTDKIAEDHKQTHDEALMTESPMEITSDAMVNDLVTKDLTVEIHAQTTTPESAKISTESANVEEQSKFTKVPEPSLEDKDELTESSIHKVTDTPITSSLETVTETLPESVGIEDHKKATTAETEHTEDLLTTSPEVVTELITEKEKDDDSHKATDISKVTDAPSSKVTNMLEEVTTLLDEETQEETTGKPMLESTLLDKDADKKITMSSEIFVPVETTSQSPEDESVKKDVIFTTERDAVHSTEILEHSSRKPLETEDQSLTTQSHELSPTSTSHDGLVVGDMSVNTESDVTAAVDKTYDGHISQDVDKTVTEVSVPSTQPNEEDLLKDSSPKVEQEVGTQASLDSTVDSETNTKTETITEKEQFEPDTLSKDEDKVTSSYIGEQYTELPEEVLTDMHKPSTESSDSLIDDEIAKTEISVTPIQQTGDEKVSTDVPQSLITQQPETETEISAILSTETHSPVPEDVHVSDDQIKEAILPELHTESPASMSHVTQKETTEKEILLTDSPVSATTIKDEYSHETQKIYDATTSQPKEPEYITTEGIEIPTKLDLEGSTEISKQPDISKESLDTKPVDETSKLAEYETSKPIDEFSESTPYFIELEEHTHKSIDEVTPEVYHEEQPSTATLEVQHADKEEYDVTTDNKIISEQGYHTEEIPKESEGTEEEEKPVSTIAFSHDDLDKLHTTELPLEKSTEHPTEHEKHTTTHGVYIESDTEDTKHVPTSYDKETSTPATIDTTLNYEKQETPKHEEQTTSVTDVEKEIAAATDKPLEVVTPARETTAPEEEFIPAVTKTTTKIAEDITTLSPAHFDKFTSPQVKPTESVSSTSPPELPKPGFNDVLPTDDIPSTDDESHFPPTGTSGYGQEPDYGEEDQTFGPGTCRYGGKVYVSAQQIPRDDPCDFCFCFRSDIICLQQSCPPPIHGCHEEPIQGFCCPRYECPVSMATTLNITTTTTTTTTTLPPHFLPHAYKGAAQRRGCQIKGHTYKVGEVVRASSGPCLHCTCGGDGQMKCDPKACTPEPMLRQMIAAAVSSKRRR